MVGLELVTGNGDIVRLSADSHLDTFRAAGVSVNQLPTNLLILSHYHCSLPLPSLSLLGEYWLVRCHY